MYQILLEREELKRKIKDLKMAERFENGDYFAGNSETERSILMEKLGKLEAEKKECEKYFFMLKDSVRQYRKKRIDEIKEKIRADVVKYINEINAWKNVNFEHYKRIMHIKKKMHKFTNFKNQLQKVGRNIKDKVIKSLEVSIDSCMFREDMMVDMLIKMEEMYLMEEFMHECIFINMIYAKIYDEFSFHFFTQKETNRLDKPEWYLKFITDQLEKYKFACECYDMVISNVKKNKMAGSNIANIKESEPYRELNLETPKNTMNGLIDRIHSIIEIKVNELRKCKSGQKRDLLLHFAEEFILFKEHLKVEYKVDFNIVELANFILEVQKNTILDSLNQVHGFDSCEWFRNYEQIYKENFLLACSYMCLQKNIFSELINFITNTIVDFLEVFIDKMCFTNKEEKDVICFIIVEIDKLRQFLEIEGNMLIIQLEDKYINCGLEDAKNMQIDVRRFLVLNNSNVKLLKTIIYHEISQILVDFLYFSNMVKKSIVQNCLQIFEILSQYDKRLGSYKKIVDEYIFNKIDNFLVEKIVLRNKFNSDTLFLYKELVENITRMYTTRTTWQCLLAYKILESIFDGAREGDSFFMKIYEIYK